MTSPFLRFTADDVREILRDAGLPQNLDDETLALVGITSLKTQREKVLALFGIDPDVEAIFDGLGGQVPKSSIRSYLSRATDAGIIGSEWRRRRRRGTGRRGAR